MDDLVKRLRDNMKDVDAYESHISNAMSEAADRIERLEAALSGIYAWYPISVAEPRQSIDEIREFARTVLGREKDGSYNP